MQSITHMREPGLYAAQYDLFNCGYRKILLPALMVSLCHAVCKSWHMAHAWREVGVKHSSSFCISDTACARHIQAGMFWHNGCTACACCHELCIVWHDTQALLIWCIVCDWCMRLMSVIICGAVMPWCIYKGE